MIGFLDCSTGVSGDKLLGALLDVGTVTGRFTAQHLGALASSLAPEARVTVEHMRSHGISGYGLHVESQADSPHRRLSDIEDLIDSAQLPDAVRDRAKAVFSRLAAAEALVHGVEAGEVHFHEVGALDAIVDVVGVVAGLNALDVETLHCTPVAVGSGTVHAAHGTLPVPAPATARLLIGTPVYGGPVESELTTPTGAALLSVLVASFGDCPPMVPAYVGHGVGSRDIGVPNVCRLMLGELDKREPPLDGESVTVLETNVDHLSGEAIAVAVQQLLDEGALDASVLPLLMKKGRPAYRLEVLVRREQADPLARRLVVLTGTLGVRVRPVERLVAPRAGGVMQTAYGPIRLKSGPAGPRAEADDIARIARETGRAFADVADEIETLARD